MDYKRIELLLDKYWRCETTIAEEEELRYFFNSRERLPGHLQGFKEVFAFQLQERQRCLTEDFDRKILTEIRQGKVRRPVFRKVFFRVAMVVLLFSIAGGVFTWQRRKYLSDKQAREQAWREVKQALNFASLKLNRGQQVIEKNMEEVKVVTQFIKE